MYVYAVEILVNPKNIDKAYFLLYPDVFTSKQSTIQLIRISYLVWNLESFRSEESRRVIAMVFKQRKLALMILVESRSR